MPNPTLTRKFACSPVKLADEVGTQERQGIRSTPTANASGPNWINRVMPTTLSKVIADRKIPASTKKVRSRRSRSVPLAASRQCSIWPRLPWSTAPLTTGC